MFFYKDGIWDDCIILSCSSCLIKHRTDVDCYLLLHSGMAFGSQNLNSFVPNTENLFRVFKHHLCSYYYYTDELMVKVSGLSYVTKLATLVWSRDVIIAGATLNLHRLTAGISHLALNGINLGLFKI